jgi:hypothetical protein
MLLTQKHSPQAAVDISQADLFKRVAASKLLAYNDSK